MYTIVYVMIFMYNVHVHGYSMLKLPNKLDFIFYFNHL